MGFPVWVAGSRHVIPLVGYPLRESRGLGLFAGGQEQAQSGRFFPGSTFGNHLL